MQQLPGSVQILHPVAVKLRGGSSLAALDPLMH